MPSRTCTRGVIWAAGGRVNRRGFEILLAVAAHAVANRISRAVM